MTNSNDRFHPEAMTFTQLLDEYIQDRQREEQSDSETSRLAEIMYELNRRCAPKKA